ncbi:MAG: hypothetical protein GF329_20230 [Candidatus Lokiarchaeota archaeon]|nr:hypothetical protein [Candidatus Lokiarchaeota archaeon]
MDSFMVPTEILDAFKQKGYTILIKGKAGTGKTTLSLELIESAKEKIYISSRMTPKNIVSQFPWLKSNEISFIDATQTFIQDDSITSQIERAIRFREMPGFLQKLYDIVKEKSDRPIVVIDSWDAIKAGIFDKGLKAKRVESVLAEMVRYLKFNLILIVESEEQYLDYISDGIVELRSEVNENRRIRTIEIKKMRGVEIKQPEYLFSLHKGRFRNFAKISEYIPLKKLTNAPPVIKNTKNRLLSYSNSLNEFFDHGQKKGVIRLLEIGNGVGFEYIWLLIPSIINQLQQNCGITIIPDEGMDFKLIFNVISKYIPEEKFNKYLSFFDFPPTYREPEDFKNLINLFDPNEDLETLTTNLSKNMSEKIAVLDKKYGYSGGIAIFGSNRFENRFGVEDVLRLSMALSEFIKLFRKSNMIYLSHSSQKINKKIASMVTTHFKIERVSNTLVIYGIIPFTKLHAIIINFREGYPKIKLYPIV